MKRFDLYRHHLSPTTVVLEASAGTGKTFSLTALVIRLLLEGIAGGRRPTLDGILLVTFTNKATDELRTRLRSRLSLACRLWAVDEPDTGLLAEAAQEGFLLDYHRLRTAQRATDLVHLRAAEAVIDQAPVSTIHGFCRRVLGEFAGRIGLPPDVTLAEDEADRRAAACRDAWRAVISQEADAAVVQSVVAQVDAKDDAGIPIGFDDLERDYTAWVGADRPFLPVEEDVADLRARWAGLDAAQRLAAAAAAWSAARSSPDLSRRRGAARRVLMQRIDERLRLGCGRDGVLSMDGLQQHLRAALLDPGRREGLIRDLQERYPAVLIDEFQDTDPVQMAIFTTAFSGGFLRCIGDPKQSIYRFRGADLHAYLDFVRGSAIEVMDRNFRSAPGCVAVVNHLFRAERNPFLQPGVAFAPSQAQRLEGLLADGEPRQLVWWWLEAAKKPEAERLLIAAVAGELRRLLVEARLRNRPEPGFRARDAAVLTATNRQAALVADALRAAGIPAVNRSQESVFASEAARELATILAGLADPGNGALARTALCTRLWGGTQALLSGPAEALSRELAAQRGLARWWRHQGVLGVVGQILRRQQTRARLLGEAGGERYLTDLLHVAELAQAAGDRPAAVLAWLHRQRESAALGDGARLRLEDDGDAVAVMTVHAAKGLEWPVVFAPFLWCSPRQAEMLVSLRTGEAGSLRPVKHRDPDGWTWDWRQAVDPVAADAADADARAEAVRQVYVALTRARERTYVAWGPLGKAGRNAARSGLALIAGEAVVAGGGRPGLEQAQQTEAWLWPDLPSPATLAAARILQGLPKGANKKQLLEAGVAEGDWKKVSEELRRFGWAELAGKTYIPTGKPLEDVPVPPDAAAFRRHLGDPPAPGIHEVVAPPAGAGRIPRPLDDRAWAAAGSAGGLQAPWSITSFSGLTRGADEQDLLGALGDEAPGARDRTPGTGIHAFPAGPGPGESLHQIIEHADLSRPDCERNRELIRACLAGERLKTPQEDVVVGLLGELAASRIPGTTTTLAGIPAGQLRHEWAFDLTMRSPGGISGLADAFRRQADAVLDVAWAERVAALRQHDLAGFLNGRADLIACIDGRWWVIDWKSNRLGGSAEAYTAQALIEDAVGHRYPLQWMLYLVALHRHLSARVPGYTVGEHLGGAAYCYLRGLRREDPAAGWLVHRPAPAFILAIDAALGGNPQGES